MRSKAITRRLTGLLRRIPLCEDVELGYCGFHEGVRVWVRLKHGWHEPSRYGNDWWRRWPNGLSLGAGTTPRKALASAESHVDDLIAYVEKGMAGPVPEWANQDKPNGE